MAKKSARHRRKKLEPLTGIRKAVMEHLVNAIAFNEYPGCCSVDDLAAQFKRQPNRFRPTLQRLVDAGYVTISGSVLEMVYPTAEAIRRQNPKLSEADAQRIVRRIKRA